jgi:hypothetical protein
MLKQADAGRTAEMEEWLPVSISTDHDKAEDFMATDQGKFFLNAKR